MTAAVPTPARLIAHKCKTVVITLSDADLGDQLAGLLPQHRDCHLMLDCNQVRRIGAAELTALLALRYRLRADCGRVSLFNLGAHVHDIFAVAGLSTFFTPLRQQGAHSENRQGGRSAS